MTFIDSIGVLSMSFFIELSNIFDDFFGDSFIDKPLSSSSRYVGSVQQLCSEAKDSQSPIADGALRIKSIGCFY
jgi:hypothetical protein